MKKLCFLFLLLICSLAHAQQVVRNSIPSRHLGHDVPAVIILPTSEGEKSFPVIYMLHGYNQDENCWLDIRPDLPQIAQRLGIIIVCPGVGNTWYVDSPVVPDQRCESFMIHELIAYIDSHYPTRKDRRGRAITGLSMGGYGSFRLAGKYPNLFGAAGSTSGPIDILPFPDRWGKDKVFGTFEQHAETRKEYNIIQHPELFTPQIACIFDCGTKDFFHEGNAQLHRILLEKKVPHTYISQPGTHNMDYWRISALQHLLFFAEFFRAGVDAPPAA